MRHAFSTLGCVGLSWPGVAALASAQGIEGVELRGLGGELDLPAYFSRTYGTPAALAGAIRHSSVSLVALNTSFSLAGHGAENRAALLDYVPWAEACGVPWLRVFDGKEEGAGKFLPEALVTLRWWDELRAAQGWRTQLMIETHDSLVDTARLESFLAAAPHAAILWDAHNTWRKGGELPEVLWPAIRHRVVHVHVKDSIDQPSARHPFTYTLPGAGQFPMAALRDALAQDGYAGFVSLEWERHWHPYLPPLEEALVAARVNHWW